MPEERREGFLRFAHALRRDKPKRPHAGVPLRVVSQLLFQERGAHVWSVEEQAAQHCERIRVRGVGLAAVVGLLRGQNAPIPHVHLRQPAIR